MDGLQDRFLNVSLLPGSEAHLAYYARMNSSLPGAARPVPARPALQLHFFGGKHDRRLRAVVTVGSGAADSRHGLGGYHGSTNVAGAAVYYAVGVYSEGGNGVPVFDQPWKNVAATFCHELNEARTDPDVEDAIRTGDSSRLGWYSAEGGEVGDIPVREPGTRLALVFTEIELADGSGAVPVQLMWSNQDDGPARCAG